MTDYHFIRVDWDECTWSTSYELFIIRAFDELDVTNWLNSFPAEKRPFSSVSHIEYEEDNCVQGVWCFNDLMVRDYNVEIDNCTAAEINDKIKFAIPNIVNFLRNKNKETYNRYACRETFFLGTTHKECIETLEGIFDFGHMSYDWPESVMNHRPLVRHSHDCDSSESDYKEVKHCVGNVNVQIVDLTH